MRRRTILETLLAMPLLARVSLAGAETVPYDVASGLAPKGRMRIAINYGNVVLARRDEKTGDLSGVSVDIAAELARRTGLPYTLVPFDAAGKVSAVATKDVWDIAFLARDPERARELAFTAPYVVINGTYVVRKDSPFATAGDVDRDGVRIAVSAKSVYDLFLTRNLKHARTVGAASPPEAAAMFQAQHLEACAGVQAAMQQLVGTDASLRMIPEPFMQIQQAMAMPAGRGAASAYLSTFVEAIKSEGFVQKALARNGQGDAMVAPPG